MTQGEASTLFFFLTHVFRVVATGRGSSTLLLDYRESLLLNLTHVVDLVDTGRGPVLTHVLLFFATGRD